MLINLFSDSSVLTRAARPLGYIRRPHDCEIVSDVSDILGFKANDQDTQYHLDLIIGNLSNKSRNYSQIMDNWVDSHSDIEKLGICKYQSNYTVIISMEDSLSYILHRLCGAEMGSIEAIQGYKEISRGILKLNYKSIENYNFDILAESDPKLLDFMHSLYNSCTSEDEEDISMEFIEKFLSKILKELSKVLEYISFSYYFSVKEEGSSEISIRSKSLSSFIFTSPVKLEDSLEIVCPGYSSHTLLVRSFAKKEYLQSVGLEYAI